MDLDETLRILREAKGDPARISLASVDLLLAEHPESEREKLRVALQVAAVPHWFDEEILGVLLDGPLTAEVQSLASQLRRLPVIEPFPARGTGAANVHETSRRALRSWMKGKAPDWLAAKGSRLTPERRATSSDLGSKIHSVPRSSRHHGAQPESSSSSARSASAVVRWHVRRKPPGF